MQLPPGCESSPGWQGESADAWKSRSSSARSGNETTSPGQFGMRESVSPGDLQGTPSNEMPIETTAAAGDHSEPASFFPPSPLQLQRQPRTMSDRCHGRAVPMHCPVGLASFSSVLSSDAMGSSDVGAAAASSCPPRSSCSRDDTNSASAVESSSDTTCASGIVDGGSYGATNAPRGDHPDPEFDAALSRVIPGAGVFSSADEGSQSDEDVADSAEDNRISIEELIMSRSKVVVVTPRGAMANVAVTELSPKVIRTADEFVEETIMEPDRSSDASENAGSVGGSLVLSPSSFGVQHDSGSTPAHDGGKYRHGATSGSSYRHHLTHPSRAAYDASHHGVLRLPRVEAKGTQGDPAIQMNESVLLRNARLTASNGNVAETGAELLALNGDGPFSGLAPARLTSCAAPGTVGEVASSITAAALLPLSSTISSASSSSSALSAVSSIKSAGLCEDGNISNEIEGTTAASTAQGLLVNLLAGVHSSGGAVALDDDDDDNNNNSGVLEGRVAAPTFTTQKWPELRRRITVPCRATAAATPKSAPPPVELGYDSAATPPRQITSLQTPSRLEVGTVGLAPVAMTSRAAHHDSPCCMSFDYFPAPQVTPSTRQQDQQPPSFTRPASPEDGDSALSVISSNSNSSSSRLGTCHNGSQALQRHQHNHYYRRAKAGNGSDRSVGDNVASELTEPLLTTLNVAGPLMIGIGERPIEAKHRAPPAPSGDRIYALLSTSQAAPTDELVDQRVESVPDSHSQDTAAPWLPPVRQLSSSTPSTWPPSTAVISSRQRYFHVIEITKEAVKAVCIQTPQLLRLVHYHNPTAIDEDTMSGSLKLRDLRQMCSQSLGSETPSIEVRRNCILVNFINVRCIILFEKVLLIPQAQAPQPGTGGRTNDLSTNSIVFQGGSQRGTDTKLAAPISFELQNRRDAAADRGLNRTSAVAVARSGSPSIGAETSHGGIHFRIGASGAPNGDSSYHTNHCNRDTSNYYCHRSSSSSSSSSSSNNNNNASNNNNNNYQATDHVISNDHVRSLTPAHSRSHRPRPRSQRLFTSFSDDKVRSRGRNIRTVDSLGLLFETPQQGSSLQYSAAPAHPRHYSPLADGRASGYDLPSQQASERPTNESAGKLMWSIFGLGNLFEPLSPSYVASSSPTDRGKLTKASGPPAAVGAPLDASRPAWGLPRPEGWMNISPEEEDSLIKKLFQIFQLRTGSPREFAILESLLVEACSYLTDELAPIVHDAEQINVSSVGHLSSTHRLHEISDLKRRVDSLSDRIKGVYEALQELLNNEEDLRRLELSRFWAHPGEWENPADSAICEDVEILLECYEQEVESMLKQINRIDEGLDDTLQMIQLHLATIRNAFLKSELGLDIVGTVVTFVGALAGIFGMNIPNGFEGNDGIFWPLAHSMVAVCAVTAIFTVLIFRRVKL